MQNKLRQRLCGRGIETLCKLRRNAAFGHEGFRPHPVFDHPLPDPAPLNWIVVRGERGQGVAYA